MGTRCFGVMGLLVVGSIVHLEVWRSVPLIRTDSGTSRTKALGRDMTSGHLCLVRLKQCGHGRNPQPHLPNSAATRKFRCWQRRRVGPCQAASACRSACVVGVCARASVHVRTCSRRLSSVCEGLRLCESPRNSDSFPSPACTGCWCLAHTCHDLYHEI